MVQYIFWSFKRLDSSGWTFKSHDMTKGQTDPNHLSLNFNQSTFALIKVPWECRKALLQAVRTMWCGSLWADIIQPFSTSFLSDKRKKWPFGSATAAVGCFLNFYYLCLYMGRCGTVSPPDSHSTWWLRRSMTGAEGKERRSAENRRGLCVLCVASRWHVVLGLGSPSCPECPIIRQQRILSQ